MIFIILQKLQQLVKPKKKMSENDRFWSIKEESIDKEDPYLEFIKYRDMHINHVKLSLINPPKWVQTNFILSTVDMSTGQVNSRTICLTKSSDTGFQFIASDKSNKILESENNNKVSALFYFADTIGAQVRVKGVLKKNQQANHDKEYQQCPRGLQILQIIASGKISQKIEDNRQEMINQYLEMEKSEKQNFQRSEDHYVYIVEPTEYIFYKSNKQHGDNGLAIQYIYEKNQDGNWDFSYQYP